MHQTSLCDDCEHECAPIVGVEACAHYKPLLPNVYQSAQRPRMTEYGAVDAFLKELERARSIHDWSGYDIQTAAAKVLCEAAEVYHAAQHYSEGRDTIEHILQELDHVGATAIRTRLLIGEGK